MNETKRDYNLISPSAKWVLLMKGHTTIPYAKQTAELISLPEKFVPDFDNKNIYEWARTMHFEWRYLSINQLLDDLDSKNILELSGGYSLRGLDYVQRKNVYYIDTDLPDMSEKKQWLISELDQSGGNHVGKLEVQSLNALDEDSFLEIVSHFPPGKITIINEGLMPYLGDAEKEKLCHIIHKVLMERGGYWINGDIYIKLEKLGIKLQLDDQTAQFFKEQKLEENRFESFEAAKAFFRKNGFEIDKEAQLDYNTLSTLPYLMKNINPEDLKKGDKMPKIHTTWRLRAV